VKGIETESKGVKLNVTQISDRESETSCITNKPFNDKEKGVYKTRWRYRIDAES